MNLFTRTFSKIFKSSNQQELDKPKFNLAINDKESETKRLSESEIKEKLYISKKMFKMVRSN